MGRQVQSWQDINESVTNIYLYEIGKHTVFHPGSNHSDMDVPGVTTDTNPRGLKAISDRDALGFLRRDYRLHRVKYIFFIFTNMMTSSNGNIFRVTDPLCGEFTGHRWIPLTKASDAGLSCFLWYAPEKRLSKQSRRRWFEPPSSL